MSSLVVVETFLDVLSAEIAKGRLESEGIVCYLQDENTVSAQPFYALAIGGVKLLASEENAEKCKIILQENDAGKMDERPITNRSLEDRLRDKLHSWFGY